MMDRTSDYEGEDTETKTKNKKKTPQIFSFLLCCGQRSVYFYLFTCNNQEPSTCASLQQTGVRLWNHDKPEVTCMQNEMTPGS
jgi:hypothetical protein